MKFVNPIFTFFLLQNERFTGRKEIQDFLFDRHLINSGKRFSVSIKLWCIVFRVRRLICFKVNDRQTIFFHNKTINDTLKHDTLAFSFKAIL